MGSTPWSRTCSSSFRQVPNDKEVLGTWYSIRRGDLGVGFVLSGTASADLDVCDSKAQAIWTLGGKRVCDDTL